MKDIFLLEIIGLLEHGQLQDKKWTTAELRSYFDVDLNYTTKDERTINRYLKNIENEFKMPINNKLKEKYFTSDISENENKYEMLLREYISYFINDSYMKELTQNILKNDKHSLSKLVNINLAIKTRKIIKFDYRYEDSGYIKKGFKFCPETINIIPGRLLLLGYRPDNKKFKQYYIDNILNVEIIVDSLFEKHKGNIKKDFYQFSWNIWHGEDVYNAKILFKGEAATRIKNKFFHNTQKITEKKNGDIIFEVTISNLYEILSWIFRFGKDAIILEPKELKEAMIGRLKEISSVYKNDN